MVKHTLLAAVLAGLSLLEPSCGAAQTRLRRFISLSGETVRIPASEVIPNFTTSTSYGIDYLEYFPPNPSFADRAAQVQSTLGGVCHVGRIPGTRFEIAQSCPAQKNKNDRIKAWRDFFNGKGGAPIPKGSEVYVIRNGTEVIPVVERELKSWDTPNWKAPISISLSPACAFPNPAKGERITDLCSRSIPVQFPPFAAKIEGGDVVLTRLQSATATAYLSFTSQRKEVARVEVRVQAPVAPPQTAPVQAPGAPQPASSVCNFRRVIAGADNKITVVDTPYGVGQKITVFSTHSVPTGGACAGIELECRQPDPKKALVVWYRGKQQFNPSGFFSSCRVEAPPCPTGQSLMNYTHIDGDGDTFYVQAPPPSGKEFASVCLLNGTKLPYRDPLTRKGYAMTIATGQEEDARCDGDARGQVYVDLQRYAGDGDGDGFYAEYQTPLKGCVKKPTHRSYLGYLERPGKAPMPIMGAAPAGREESLETDGGTRPPAGANSTNVCGGSQSGSASESTLLSSVEGSKKFTCSDGAGDPWKLVQDGGTAYCFRKAENFDYELTKFDERKLLSSCSNRSGEGLIEKIFYKPALRDPNGEFRCCEQLSLCDPEHESYQANVDSGLCDQPEGGSCSEESRQSVEVQVAEIHTRHETVDNLTVIIDEVVPVDPTGQLTALDPSCQRESGEEEVRDLYSHFLGISAETPMYEQRSYVRALRYTYRCATTVPCGGGSQSSATQQTTYDPGSRLYVMRFEAKMPSTCFDGHPFAYAPGVTSCWDGNGAPFTRKDRHGNEQVVRDDIGSSTTTARQLSDQPGNHPNFISSPSTLYLRCDNDSKDMWGYPNHWSRPAMQDQRRYIDAMAVPFIVYPSCFNPGGTLRESILGDYAHVVTDRGIATAIGGDANLASFTSQPEWSARLFELQGARQEQGCAFQRNNWDDADHNFLYVFDEGKLARGHVASSKDVEPAKTYHGNQQMLLRDISRAENRFRQKFSPRILRLMAKELFNFELDFRVGPTLFTEAPRSGSTDALTQK